MHPESFAHGLKKNPKKVILFNMRIMGLDVGDKTIGIALSDESMVIAEPYSTLKRESFLKDLEGLKRIVEERSVHKIVVGMPVNMDGSLGVRAGAITRFIERISEGMDVPVSAWDERLSTRAVEKVLIQGNVSRLKRKKVVDKLAASYILQGYLDSIARDKGLSIGSSA
jgi:putative Holliday junction resolvase